MKRKNRTPLYRPTLYMLLVDCSQSMLNIKQSAKSAFLSIVNKILEVATSPDDKIVVAKFGTEYKPWFDYRVGDLRRINNNVGAVHSAIESYSPMDGCTRLNDAIMMALSTGFANEATMTGIYEAALMYIITDGLENSSTHTYAAARNRIKIKQLTGRWTFAMQVPMGARYKCAENYGVPLQNISEWEQTDYGTRSAAVDTVNALRQYTNARASGQTASQDFYANTNASKVTPDTLKRQCLDVTRKIKKFTVERETEVRQFVEKKLARPYIIGSAYYQLMKPEKVQADKEVLIVEKGRNTVYGGPKARALIGIPTGVPVKVTPGNHSDYDIFVQSRSVNRKLPRGTQVLVDVKQTKNLVPTWDHTQVTQ